LIKRQLLLKALRNFRKTSHGTERKFKTRKKKIKKTNNRRLQSKGRPNLIKLKEKEKKNKLEEKEHKMKLQEKEKKIKLGKRRKEIITNHIAAK